MPEYKDFPFDYSETTIEQKEVFRHLKKKHPEWQEVRPMFGIYKPSNYLLKEQTIHTIIDKLDGVLYRMSTNKSQQNKRAINDYEVLYNRSKAYENRNRISPEGYKLHSK